MSDEANYEQFLRLYNSLRAKYFGPQSRIQVDDEGQQIPSCHETSAQLCERFASMGVHVPKHRLDPPHFLDGTVGPAYVEPK